MNILLMLTSRSTNTTIILMATVFFLETHRPLYTVPNPPIPTLSPNSRSEYSMLPEVKCCIAFHEVAQCDAFWMQWNKVHEWYIPYTRERAPMGGEPHMLTEQGTWHSFEFSAFNHERVSICTSSRKSGPARHVLEPSQDVYIAGVTSNISHVIFTGVKRSLRSRVVVLGQCIFVFTGKPTCIDTIDMDTQTHRDFCKQSFLPQIRVEHLKSTPLSHEARG